MGGLVKSCMAVSAKFHLGQSWLITFLRNVLLLLIQINVCALSSESGQHPVFYLDFKAGWIGDISEIHISCTVADTSSNLINILNGNEVSYHTFGYAIWTHACWRVWALSPQFRWLHTASITLRFRIYGVQSITDCIGSVFGLSYWEMELLTITHFLAGGSTFDLCPTPLAEIQIPKQGRAPKVFYKWL